MLLKYLRLSRIINKFSSTPAYRRSRNPEFAGSHKLQSYWRELGPVALMDPNRECKLVFHGAGFKLLGSKLGLIKAGLAEVELQNQSLGWVVAVCHMGQRPVKS